MKKSISLILILIMLLSLCACSARQDVASTVVMGYDAPETALATEAVMYNSATDSVAEAEYGGFAAATGTALANSTLSTKRDAEAQNGPDKIIYSADATVETTDFDGCIEKVSQLAEACGGWIESSSINGSNYYDTSRGRVSNRSASYTLRVPSESFNAIMSELPSLGNVPYSYTYTDNVSAQYYDTQARLTAYQTQEQRLLEMMDMAQTVEDIIAIEGKLTELRYQIESLQSSLNNWDRQVDYSRIYLSIEEVQEYTPETVVRPSYGEKLLRAVKDGFEGVGEFFSELLLWLLEALPTLVILGLVIFCIVKLRRIRKARKQAKAEKKAVEK